MVERVARVLQDQGNAGGTPLADFERQPPGWQEHHRRLARAAIEALREPTEAMLAAGMAEAEVDLASEYRAMIDSALSDPDKPAVGVAG